MEIKIKIPSATLHYYDGLDKDKAQIMALMIEEKLKRSDFIEILNLLVNKAKDAVRSDLQLLKDVEVLDRDVV